MRYFDFAFHSTFLFLHSTARIFRTQHLALSGCRASSHSASENRSEILSKERSVWCIIVDLLRFSDNSSNLNVGVRKRYGLKANSIFLRCNNTSDSFDAISEHHA